MSENTSPMAVRCLGTVSFSYRNHLGKVTRRRAVFDGLYYGTTEWHPEPQWFVSATDLGKLADPGRTGYFALKDMSDVVYEP